MKNLFEGYGLGIIFVLGFVLFMWGFRPLVFPRTENWDTVRGEETRYWVGNQDCGEVDDDTILGFWGGYSDPPIWVGLGDYSHYQTKEQAMRAVEASCK